MVVFFQRIVNGEVGKLGQAVEHPAVLLMVPEIKPEQDLVQVGQMAELYVTRLMVVTPSPAALNAQVIPGDDNKLDPERESWPCSIMLPILPIQSISGSRLLSSPGRIIWFRNLVTKLCIFQWIANGEAGNHGQVVEQHAVQLMVQVIKPEQDLAQQLEMVGHAIWLTGMTPSLAVLNVQVIRFGVFVTW